LLPSKLKSANVGDQESFGAWLRREMTTQGYDVDSPRGGGRTTLAAESGVSISIISRILTGERAAEVDTLRKIGRVLGYDIIQMMIHAGLIEYTEVSATEPTTGEREPLRNPGDLGDDIPFNSLKPWERRLLMITEIPPEQRIKILTIARWELREMPAGNPVPADQPASLADRRQNGPS
jgi:transcriptional regulator with XRE-family HTH domain